MPKRLSLETKQAIRTRFLRDGVPRGVSLAEAAAEFGCSVSTIRRIMFAKHRSETTPRDERK